MPDFEMYATADEQMDLFICAIAKREYLTASKLRRAILERCRKRRNRALAKGEREAEQ